MVTLFTDITAQSKACPPGRSLSGIAGSDPTGGICLILVYVVCRQVEVSATGRLISIPQQCGGLGPSWAVRPQEKN
jgi:hypothetical protein